MDREVRRGAFPIVILALLARGPTYGYDITQSLEAESDGLFTVKEGTLYPILYRFEEAGWIEPKWDVPGRGVPRKYYQITQRGMDELRRRVEEWQKVVKSVDRILMRRPEHEE